MSSTSSAARRLITLQSASISLSMSRSRKCRRRQRGVESAAGRPAAAADLQPGQSGGHADPLPRCRRHDSAAEAERPDRHALGKRSLAAQGVGLVSLAGGQSCCARPGQSEGARRVRPQSATCARHRQRNVNQAKGTSTVRAARRRSTPTTSFAPRGIQSLIIAYRNGAPVRVTDVAEVNRRRREQAPRRMVEREPAIIVNVSGSRART